MTAIRNLSNRRTAYRVRPDSIDELDLALLEKRYKVVRGKVSDIAIGGAQVEFQNVSTEPLEAGDRVQLAVASERYDFDGKIWARIISINGDPTDQVIRFSFEDENEELSPESEEFFALFNRRAIYRRVEREPDTALNAGVSPKVHGDESLRTYPISIRNISGIGVSFEVDREADQKLQSCTDVILSLNLPNHPGMQMISCHVHHRTASSEAILYGCEFDWSGTANSLVLIEDLVAYMLERFEADERLTPDRRDERKQSG
jgi:hypothetical protein